MACLDLPRPSSLRMTMVFNYSFSSAKDCCQLEFVRCVVISFQFEITSSSRFLKQIFSTGKCWAFSQSSPEFLVRILEKNCLRGKEDTGCFKVNRRIWRIHFEKEDLCLVLMKHSLVDQIPTLSKTPIEAERVPPFDLKWQLVMRRATSDPMQTWLEFRKGSS